MSGALFAAIVSAETRKLFTRTSARFGLVFAILVGLGVPLARFGLRLLEYKVGTDMAAEQHITPVFAPVDAAYTVFITLWIRNFFLMRIILIMVAAVSFAGEFQAKTLREDILRPFPRSAMLIAKWLALVTWIGATIVLTYAPATIFSLIAFGTLGDWGEVTLGYLVTWATDASFAMLVLMAAVCLRSVAGTMVGMFLFYFFDVAVGFGLMAIANMPFFGLPEQATQAAEAAGPWLPSSAYGVWGGASPTVEWAWQGFVVLGLLFALSWAIADRVFARVDVP